jgi:branched-chain amino acid transport system permease protein
VADYLLDALVLGSIYTLFALGLTLSWGVLNVLNLAHAEVFMCGALLAYLMTKSGALSLAVVLPAAVVAIGLLAVVIDWLALRPIRHRVADMHAAELSMMIASVGAGAVLVALADMVTKGSIVAVNQETFTVQREHLVGLEITNLEIIIVIIAAALSAAVVYLVRATRIGHALRALAYDPYMCGLMGISADRMATATMFVSGALAGVAGVLFAVNQSSVESHMGDSLLLKAFAAIILGGVGSVGGAVAGAFVLAVAETATVVYVAPSLRDAVAFALVVLLLLLRPQGLFARAAWQRA